MFLLVFNHTILRIVFTLWAFFIYSGSGSSSMASTMMHCHTLATVSQNRHTKHLALERAISSIIHSRRGTVRLRLFSWFLSTTSLLNAKSYTLDLYVLKSQLNALFFCISPYHYINIYNSYFTTCFLNTFFNRKEFIKKGSYMFSKCCFTVTKREFIHVCRRWLSVMLKPSR